MRQRSSRGKGSRRIVLAWREHASRSRQGRSAPAAREARHKHCRLGVACRKPVRFSSGAPRVPNPLHWLSTHAPGPGRHVPAGGRSHTAQDFRHATAIPPAHIRGTGAACRGSAVEMANEQPCQTAFRCSVLVGMPPPPGREFREFGSSISNTWCRPVWRSRSSARRFGLRITTPPPRARHARCAPSRTAKVVDDSASTAETSATMTRTPASTRSCNSQRSSAAPSDIRASLRVTTASSWTSGCSCVVTFAVS